MDILNDKIQIAITDQEANIILQSLANYNGPWSNDANLTPQELEFKAARIKDADGMINILQDVLLSRYHESEHVPGPSSPPDTRHIHRQWG